MSTLDIVTADEVSAFLGKPADVDLMSPWATAVSLLFDQEDKCGPVVQRTITGELCTATGNYVKLAHRPLVSVSSVVEYTLTTPTTLTPETNTSKTGNDYQLDLDRGYIYRRNNGYDQSWAAGRGNIVVTYIAGRFASTDVVSEQFKRAALITIAHNWRNQQGTPNVTFPDGSSSSIAPPWAIPKAAIDILGSEYRLAGVSVA